MTTSRGNADAFARLWTTGTIAYSNGPTIAYGGDVVQLQRRKRGEYGQALLSNVERVLGQSYVTPSCREFTRDLAATALGLGCPASSILPLGLFGIDIPREKYGIFEDDLGKLAAIERTLLGIQTHALEGASLPEIKDRFEDLNKKWYTEFLEKYSSIA